MAILVGMALPLASVAIAADPSLADWTVAPYDKASAFGCLLSNREANFGIFEGPATDVEVWFSPRITRIGESAAVMWDDIADPAIQPVDSNQPIIRMTGPEGAVRERLRSSSILTVADGQERHSVSLTSTDEQLGKLDSCVQDQVHRLEAEDGEAGGQADVVDEATVKDMWCGTALAIAFAGGPQSYLDEARALVERADQAYVAAGFSDDELAKKKAALTDELRSVISGTTSAKFTFEEWQALADSNVPTVQSDTSPVKVQYFRGSRGQIKLQVQSVVDDVLVKDVVVNHGNCIPVIDFVGGHLRYGDVTELLFEQCSPLEVLVKSNFGDWTLTF